ncbi:hypothetical protein AMTRI_Chr01g111230 [Amborella trichopoda]
MALSHLSLTPTYLSRPAYLVCPSSSLSTNSCQTRISLSTFYKPYFIKPSKLSKWALALSDSNALFIQDELEKLSNFNGESLPCVRTYENDLGRMIVTGEVDLEQALTAAAADGGEAAKEHMDSGIATMVIETVYPESSGEHGTISTRLFLPARKVEEKARKLRNSLTADILSTTSSRNVLAMTFRQVVLQQIWSFELLLFEPGSERNMEELANPREIPAFCTLSSSDIKVLPVLAEVVCSRALESIKDDFLGNSMGASPKNFLHRFQKPRVIASSDSAIFIEELPQKLVVSNAKNLVENIRSSNGGQEMMENSSNNSWWLSSRPPRLKTIDGSELESWIGEYIPTHRLLIDADKFTNLKYQGWKNREDNRWEVHLSHSQMVDLAYILDMYYEDRYTLPGKHFPFRLATNVSYTPKSKRSLQLWKALSITLAGGLILVSIRILAQLCHPFFWRIGSPRTESYSILSDSSASNETKPSIISENSTNELEPLSIMVIQKIKDSLEWPGDINTDGDIGAWTGEMPSHLSSIAPEYVLESEADNEGIITTDADLENASTRMDLSENSSQAKPNLDIQASNALDIAAYEVMLSREGKVVGFQPTNRLAVNHWASNPLAKSLYGERKLSPGFWEPRLKIQRPERFILLELLISVDPDFQFALARPVQTHTLS